MKAIEVPVRQPAKVIEIDANLESLQNEVGGLIELYFPYDDCIDIAIVCNEEGRLIPLAENCDVNGEIIYGDFLIVNPGCFIEGCGTVIFESDLALLSEAKNIIDKVIKRREI